MAFGGGRRFGGGGRYGDRDSGRSFSPKPVKVGEEHVVKIEDVGAKGDGIARIENFIVFVPGGKKGEEVKVRIKEVAERFAIGEKVGEGSASSDEASEESGSESSKSESSESESSESESSESEVSESETETSESEEE